VLMKNFGACRCGALCFMRTIISVKQVPIVVVEAGQSGACLRADAQPISGDCGRFFVCAALPWTEVGFWNNTRCSLKVRRRFVQITICPRGRAGRFE
jgi:hypothetical protein